MLDSDVKVPAALNLPFGQLFFGFPIVPYTPPDEPQAQSPTADVRSLVVLVGFRDLTLAIAATQRICWYGQHPQWSPSPI